MFFYALGWPVILVRKSHITTSFGLDFPAFFRTRSTYFKKVKDKPIDCLKLAM